MEKKSKMVIKDIPLSRLETTNTRKFSNRDLTPIRTSMEEIGMLEPLVVYEEGETFLISDGNKRYYILLEAGIESVPCILAPRPDTYTPSYQVIAVSPAEREKMIIKAREKVDDARIAAAIGVPSLTPILDKSFVAGLNSAIILAYEQGLLQKTALQELKNVTSKRQTEILKELRQNTPKQGGVYSIDVIRGLVLATPPAGRVTHKRKTPWQKSEEKMNSITKELQDIEKRCDLMSGLYHTYVSDVAKLLSYIRCFMKDKKIEQHLRTKYPEIIKAFRSIMDRE